MKCEEINWGWYKVVITYIGIFIGIILVAYAGWLMFITPESGNQEPPPVTQREEGASILPPLSPSPRKETPPQPMLTLTSTTFDNNGSIPSKYTCDGANINPPLTIAGVPDGTQTLVLIMDDHDVPRSVRADGVWDHWVVFNIPSTTTVIKEGKKAHGTYGIGTNKKASYLGPCPPDREHRYSFRLYVLDTVLELTAGATKEQVLIAMKGHIIEEAELVGRYKRKR